MVGKLLLSTSRSTDGSGSPEMLAASNKKEEPRFYREKKMDMMGSFKRGGQTRHVDYSAFLVCY
jgi:hypothetical protein